MKEKIKIYAPIFIIMIATFTFFGFKYFPNLDDNNQFGVYNLRSDNTYEKVIKHYKSYSVRPLAFFNDAYILSNFWNNMYLGLLLMVILHFFSAFFLKEIFEKIRLKIGWIAIIIFAISPFLVEATYWISASSRVVVSLFFSLFSNYIFVNIALKDYSKVKKNLLLILAILFNIISCGFYEQTIVFNFILSIFISIRLKKWKWRSNADCFNISNRYILFVFYN